MAVINFFDTPLSTPSKNKIKKGSSVLTAINKYLDKKPNSQKVEVYNLKTGKTSYKNTEIESYKAAVVVNGKEESLEYVVKKDDVINVFFSPRANANGGDFLSIFGGIFMALVGGVLILAGAVTGGATVGPGISLLCGGVITLTAGIISAVTRTADEKSGRDNSQLEKKNALLLKGAENALITGNRFPFVFGKYAVNPYIVGSPFHETFTRVSGAFDSQYMTCLYCVGYGPLKLTDFKIGETALFYNHARDNDEERNNPTFMHGFINQHFLSTEFKQTVADRSEYYTYNPNKRSFDKADPQPSSITWQPNTYYELTSLIPKKWKNNDISIEILQRSLKNESGLSVEDKWGSLYNKTVFEDSIDANVLFIHDNDISGAAEKHYKGVAIPKGYRTNSVYLTQNCPIKLEVEIDFQNGLYRGRSEKIGGTSQMRYYDIPVRVAVQWRPVYKNNEVSDAEKGEGWRTFDYLKLGETPDTYQTPKPYTARHSIDDMVLNAGASMENPFYRDALQRYADAVMFPQFYNEAYPSCQADANSARPYGPYATYYTQAEKTAMASNNASSVARSKTDDWVDPTDYNKIQAAADAGYITEAIYNKGWLGTDVFCINEGKSYGTGYGPKSFDGNERLYVFEKNFTKEEVDELLASDADHVEVRVIRLTPCYIDQNGTQDDNHGDFSYADLFKWSFLRTYSFDKDAYTKALKTNSAADPHDFPLRPIREADLNKFCYVAIRLKQDVAEVGGTSLKKLRVLVDSFSPKYSKVEKKWLPENVVTKYGYYQRQKVENEWQIVELTEKQYHDAVLAREPHLFRKRKGNNFVQLLANDIFRTETEGDNRVFQSYILPPVPVGTDTQTIEEKYIDTNTACSTMLAFVGPQNGEDAKSYDDINMASATELFNFCEDVTDGQTDENGNLVHIKYSCNGVLNEEKKLEDVIKTFLVTGRSILRRDDENKYEFFIGRKQDYPVALLNSKNVIAKSNTRSFADVPSGFQLTYPAEDDDYTQNPIYVMDRGENWKNPSKPMEQLQFQYVTNRWQIRSLALYNLAGRLYQRELYNRTVGKIGLTFNIGDVVLLQDDSLLVGTDYAGRIMEVVKHDNVIYGLVVDEPYEYTGELKDGECIQGITIVQPNKYGASRCVTLRLATPKGNEYITPEMFGIGLTRVVPFAHPITVTEDGNFSDESLTENGEFCTLDPKEGNIVSFGIMSKITRKAQIMSIKPTQGKFQLSLVPYSDDFYNYGKELPQFNPNITKRKKESDEIEFSPYATKADISEATASGDENKKDLQIDLTTETTIKQCVATRDGIILSSETYHISNGERVKVNPISVTWSFVREEIWSEYTEADPQPTTQAEVDTGNYYVKDGDRYAEADTFVSGETYYTVEVHITDVPIFDITTNEEVCSYMFDRTKKSYELGGYPEYYDLYPFKVKASAKVTVSSKTAESMFARIDVGNYGTWIPQPPLIDQVVQDRNITLTFSQPPSSRAFYGSDSLIFRIRIKRLEEGVDEPFAKPNLQDNPYPEFIGESVSKGNEFNYKILKEAEHQPITDEEASHLYIKDEYGDYIRADHLISGVVYYEEDTSYYVSGKTFIQTLALKGQKQKSARSTAFQYEVRAESINGAVTEPNTAVVTALVTNLRDIVYANAAEKELYVPKLSAITANLGEITDGSLSGNEENYWTLSDKANATQEPGQDNKNFQGAFRVGGTNSFIKVVPILDPTTHQVVDYKTEISTDSVQIGGNEIDFYNGIYLYDNNDYTTHGHEGIAPYYTKRLFVSYRGIELEVYNYQTKLWNRIAQVGLKQSSSIIITNDIDGTDIPKEGIETGANSYVYHFDKDTNNEDGNDTVHFDFDGFIISDPDMNPVFEGSKIFSGVIKKQQFNEVGSHAFFIKDGYVELFGDFVTIDGGGNIKDFKTIMSTASMGGSMTFAIKE